MSIPPTEIRKKLPIRKSRARESKAESISDFECGSEDRVSQASLASTIPAILASKANCVRAVKAAVAVHFFSLTALNCKSGVEAFAHLAIIRPLASPGPPGRTTRDSPNRTGIHGCECHLIS